jgi:hypothetical protein
VRILSVVFVALLTSIAIPRTSAVAGDKIWSAVLLASNVDKPKDPPAQLRSVAERIKRIIGYNQLEVLGSSTEEVDERAQKWLLPTERFFLKVKARRCNEQKARGGYFVNLQLFHDKRELVETEAMLAPDSPLFIRGPLHARGQLLIVLQVQP